MNFNLLKITTIHANIIMEENTHAVFVYTNFNMSTFVDFNFWTLMKVPQNMELSPLYIIDYSY